MVGKNNHIRTVKSNLKEHYKAYKSGRHWVYASLASLALGAGLLLGSTTSYADTTTATAQEPTSVKANDTAATKANQSKSIVPLKTGTDSDTTNQSSDVNTSDDTASNTSKNVTGSVRSADTTSANVGEKTEKLPATKSDVNTNTSDSSTPVASTPTGSTTPANTSETKPATTSKTLVDPTDEQLNAAKAKAAQVYATTHQPQEIDAVADASEASLTLSANAIGHGTNAKSPLTLTLTTNAKAGDVYVINIPANTPVYTFGSAAPLVSQAGTTVVTTNADKSYTITDTFITDSTTTQLIKLNLIGNGSGQPAGMDDVGKTVTKMITWSIKHAAQDEAVNQTPINFTQTIKPTVNLSTVSMLYPSGNEVSQILPNKNYVYSVSVNEADGVKDDSNTTPRVNSADNYGGSTVTIPVPTGFVLDTNSTSQINGFTDGSTITQPGGKGTDIIITVPAKAGNQNFQGVQPYKLVGAFDVAQTNTTQTLTAKGNITFSQILNANGEKLTDTSNAGPWSVQLIANQGGTDVGHSKAASNAGGNSSTSPKQLVLDTDPTNDPQYLASFGFAYNSAANSTNNKFQITIPDGLNVTSIHVPASVVSPDVYLPGTTSYAYTLTLADGTTETGTVNAGNQVTLNDNSAIRTAVFEPNELAPGANTGNKDLGVGTPSSFIVYGHLSNTYDNGTPVKVRDNLISSMNSSFDASGNQLTSTSSVTETVVEATTVVPAYSYRYAHSTDPGNPKAGSLDIATIGNRGQTTNDLYEPTFYFVLPRATTIASINSENSYNPDGPGTLDPTGAALTQATGANISEFKADNGQTVVKIDYSGTGTTVDLGQPTGKYGEVVLANNPDALPGAYPYYMYVVSPKTKLTNGTSATDSSFVEGNPNAVLLSGGQDNWNIVTASSFFNASLAKGNQNPDPIITGQSGTKGDPTLNFYDSITYTSLADNAKNSNANVAINLPTVGDSKGSQYTFKLSGPIKVPADYTVVNGQGSAIKPTVLYSTQPQAVNVSATTPDTTGYVTEAQVGDWSKVRSIIIQINGIQPNTSTGRIQISGTTDNFAEQANKTGYLQTIFYGNGAPASVSSKDASLKIVGQSTVKARFHYVDANGADKYIDLPDLNKTLTDGVDTFTNNYPTQLSGFSTTDQGLIPAGYKLVTDASGKATSTIIDGTGNGKAQFGQVSQSYYDGDFVQYDLISSQTSLKVTYVDTDNNNAVVDTPETITGTEGGTGTYTVKVPANYVLAPGQASNVPYTLKTDDSDNLTIKLKHQHTTKLPDGFTGTTHRTITYTGVSEGNPASISQPLTWTTDTDEVTGTTTYTPKGGYTDVPSPVVAGYTPNVATVPAGTDKVTTTQPKDSSVTVTYIANKADLTVTYEDVDNGDAVVGTLETLTGKTDGTGTYTVKVPDNYVLAPNQAATVPYKFTQNNSDNLIIKLAHKLDHTTTTSTRTIHYVVDDPSFTGQVPAPTVQTITWNVVTDEVTGNSIATPQGAYYEQSVPELVGYTATPAKVSQQAVGAVIAHDIPMYNEDEVVTYTPTNSGQPNQQNQPGQPNQPVQPTQPLQPTQPIEPTQPTTPSAPDEGTVVNKTTTPGKSVTETANSGTATSRTAAKNGNGSQSSFGSGVAGTLRTSTATQNDSVGNQSDSSIDQQNNQQKLPQTNEQNHSEVGLGLFGLLTSMLGLVSLKRRKRDDE